MSTVMWMCVVSVLWVAGCAVSGRMSGGVEQDIQTAGYPSHWWAAVPREDAARWEILPQEARQGEVIVSKRNELGLLSNFAPTPFVFRGRRYPSLEGFWQMMKYPEAPADPRATFPGINWQHTREEVSQMVGEEAKAAGDLGSENMRTMGIDWVTFDGRRMKYWGAGKGEHYELIVAAMREKVQQNPKVRKVLLSTGGLALRPDHRQDSEAPPAWRYCEILMEIREALRGGEVCGFFVRRTSLESWGGTGSREYPCWAALREGRPGGQPPQPAGSSNGSLCSGRSLPSLNLTVASILTG